jgi:hypothetical protein
VAYQVKGWWVQQNTSAARLRELAEQMPSASRSTRSTYLVDDSVNSGGQAITRDEYGVRAEYRPGRRRCR